MLLLLGRFRADARVLEALGQRLELGPLQRDAKTATAAPGTEGPCPVPYLGRVLDWVPLINTTVNDVLLNMLL